MNWKGTLGAVALALAIGSPGAAEAQQLGGRDGETDKVEAALMAEIMAACVTHAGLAADFRQMDISAWPGLRPMSTNSEDELAYVDLRPDGVYLSVALSDKECAITTHSSLTKRILSDVELSLAPLGEVRGPNRDVSGFFVFRVNGADGQKYRATVSANSADGGGFTALQDSWVILRRD